MTLRVCIFSQNLFLQADRSVPYLADDVEGVLNGLLVRALAPSAGHMWKLRVMVMWTKHTYQMSVETHTDPHTHTHIPVCCVEGKTRICPCICTCACMHTNNAWRGALPSSFWHLHRVAIQYITVRITFPTYPHLCVSYPRRLSSETWATLTLAPSGRRDVPHRAPSSIPTKKTVRSDSNVLIIFCVKWRIMRIGCRDNKGEGGSFMSLCIRGVGSCY